MTEQNGSIKSIRQLARRMNRSAPAVSHWVKRDDWVFGPGPWPEAMLPLIEEWRDIELQDRCELVSSPGPMTITAQHLLDPTSPLYLRHKLSRAEWAGLTIASVEALAAGMTACNQFLLNEKSEELGEGRLPRRARDEVYRRLARLLDNAQLAGAWNACFQDWAKTLNHAGNGKP